MVTMRFNSNPVMALLVAGHWGECPLLVELFPELPVLLLCRKDCLGFPEPSPSREVGVGDQVDADAVDDHHHLPAPPSWPKTRTTLLLLRQKVSLPPTPLSVLSQQATREWTMFRYSGYSEPKTPTAR